jgi:solute carrier family 35 protein E3
LLGLFEKKHGMPVQPRVILAASFVGYNAASLVNLNVNTVGFYQISKILVTPTVMVMNFLFFGEGTDTQVKIAVVFMMMGVGLATVSDVDVTFFGFLVGCAAIIGAAQQQIMIGKIQKQLGCTSNQLLVSYTPFVVTMLAACTVIDMQLPENTGQGYDAYGNWYRDNGTMAALLTIFISSCLGLLVSMSTFLLIGATSPLTYNIVGHVKTVAILTMGVVFFGDSMSGKKFTGICLALVGVVLYSKDKLAKQAAAKQLAAKKTPEQNNSR